MTDEHNETAEIVADAVAQERVAVVAWLRGQLCARGRSADQKEVLRWAFVCIARGDHRR